MRFAITSGVCPERLLGEAEAGSGRGGWLGVGREDGPSRRGGCSWGEGWESPAHGGRREPQGTGCVEGCAGAMGGLPCVLLTPSPSLRVWVSFQVEALPVPRAGPAADVTTSIGPSASAPFGAGGQAGPWEMSNFPVACSAK